MNFLTRTIKLTAGQVYALGAVCNMITVERASGLITLQAENGEFEAQIGREYHGDTVGTIHTIKSTITEDVTITTGMGWTLASRPAPASDINPASFNLANGETRTIYSEGYGTLFLSISNPTTGTSTILSAVNGSGLAMRDMAGNVIFAGGVIPSGYSGNVFIDLEGTGGVTFTHYGAGTLTGSGLVLSSLPRPQAQQRRQPAPISGFASGGTPYAAGATQDSATITNYGSKLVTLDGQFNGTAGDSILIGLQPVDATGTVYNGAPVGSFVTVPVNTPFHVTFDLENGTVNYDIYGVGNGVTTGLTIGAADFLVRLRGTAAANAWGVVNLSGFELMR